MLTAHVRGRLGKEGGGEGKVREGGTGKRSNMGSDQKTHRVTRAELVPLRLVMLLSPLLRTLTQCLCIGAASPHNLGETILKKMLVAIGK
jgi:hypothetical protein